MPRISLPDRRGFWWRRDVQHRENRARRSTADIAIRASPTARRAVHRSLRRPRRALRRRSRSSNFRQAHQDVRARYLPRSKTFRTALREHRRRRITTTPDNPSRGLNLVPRIATIELKKDGPDLAGGDWG